MTILLFTSVTKAAKKPIDDFPVNWRDYIAPDDLKRFLGKPFTGFSDRYFQGDLRGIDGNGPLDLLNGGCQLNSAISDESKRWTGENTCLIG